MKRILMVDDDPRLLDALARQFRANRERWELTTATDGTEALKLAEKESFDLIITDLVMPVTDGIEIIMAIRRDHPSMVIVAMSGGGQKLGKEPLEWARLLGADACLEKPFSFEDLERTVESLLE